jgi:hypothetical protein
MLLKLRRVAIASAVVIPAVAGLSVASASAAPSADFGVVHGTATSSAPNADLDGSGSSVVFNPIKLGGLTAVPQTSCSLKDYSFTITNTTSSRQVVVSNGEIVDKVPAGGKVEVCIYKPGTYKLGLRSSPGAHLRLHATTGS